MRVSLTESTQGTVKLMEYFKLRLKAVYYYSRYHDDDDALRMASSFGSAWLAEGPAHAAQQRQSSGRRT